MNEYAWPDVANDDPLLLTKLFVPPLRPGIVQRSHLVQRLHLGLQLGQRLTLLSAPAGFGKTTLLSEWIQELTTAETQIVTPAIGWLSLDENDNDLGRFLTYLIGALNQIPGLATIGKQALALVQAPQTPLDENVLVSLINELAALPAPLVLVLDDYHLINAAAVDQALAFLLEHAPRQLHLVIATRDDPQLPLPRLRARGQLNEIRAMALRFSLAETGRFLNQTMRLNLSPEAIATLEARTEGWIAGLQLAAISMQGHADAAALIHSFAGSHRFVIDYLLEEVLEQQPVETQSFLLRTAVLDRFTGALCDALTGRTDGQLMLEELERANLFIMPLDGHRRWYRYHHLFADILRQRLRQTAPAQLAVLQLQASRWYAAGGHIEEAIEYAVRARDYARAADLVEEYVDDIWQLAEDSRLQRWLNRLPDEVVNARPHLGILHAGNLYTIGQIDGAAERLAAVEAVLYAGAPAHNGRPPPRWTEAELRQLQGRAAVIKAHLVSYHGDGPEAIRCAHLALDYLPLDDATWRWSAFDCIGTVYSSVDELAAYHARLDALEASQAAGNGYMILYASLRLAVTLRDLGRLPAALAICEQQLEKAASQGLAETALVGWLYTLWAEILAEKNELDQALKLAQQGVALTERGRDMTLLGSSYLCLLRVLFSTGRFAEALELIDRIHQAAPERTLSPWITVQMAAWQARIWLRQGRVSAASLWAEGAELADKLALAPLQDFAYGVYARLQLALGELDAAAELLACMLVAAEAGGRQSKQIELRLLMALVWQADGAAARAQAALAKALAQGEADGFVRIVADEGEAVIPLLQGALAREIAPAYVRQLLAACGSPVAAPDTIDQSALVEPLSERELEVLSEIAAGFSNRQIAERLHLSTHTVKVHTRNIYGKLAVHNRTQAVARSRELGLFTTP